MATRGRGQGEKEPGVAWEWTGSTKELRDLQLYVSFIVDIAENSRKSDMNLRIVK